MPELHFADGPVDAVSARIRLVWLIDDLEQAVAGSDTRRSG